MGKQNLLCNYCTLLIVSVLLFLISCVGFNDKGTGSDLNNTSEIVESLNFSYDPFSNTYDADFHSKVFSNLLLNENSTHFVATKSDTSQLESLFVEIKRGYSLEKGTVDSLIERQYHNFPHAMDVLVTTHLLLESGGRVFLTDEEEAALLIAALGHDALHSGVFNSFLIRSNHPYALEDGNKSIQEKRSLKFLLNALDANSIFVSEKGASDQEKDTNMNSRKLIQEAILWTDMARHKEQVDSVKEVLPILISKLNKARKKQDLSNSQLGSSHSDIENGIDLSSELPSEVRHLVAGFILHCADVSNLGKPWVLSEKWAFLVCSEFFTQGDLEKQLKMDVSMNCDRESTSIPKSQINFGKYVIEELYQLLAKIISDGGGQIIENYKNNQARWAELFAEEEKSGKRYEYSKLR